ncbi:MAG: hypothetical protein ACK5LN_02255, partial [Propioniciclava sp.]
MNTFAALPSWPARMAGLSAAMMSSAALASAGSPCFRAILVTTSCWNLNGPLIGSSPQADVDMVPGFP